ncbi:hypothetical protein [Sphingomonas alba]|uniref:Uncharacterized protein n=1 Tax=Sphingomonas alba TaxID=2908208 RepID=A0ABT0RJY7_9SPHN|nr:hypothetical protein [Sphingomonas alba]MCL6682888.1 hypothetical protein [Sphingomonas alba]
MIAAGEEYEIPGIGSAAQEVLDIVESLDANPVLDANGVSHFKHHLSALHSTFINVIKDIPIFVLSTGSVRFLEGDGVGFGEAVDDAFPDAQFDASEASKCRGLERWTACVMHCMRALETPLVALAERVGADTSKENWHELLKGIEDELKARSKRAVGAEAAQFEAEAAAHFRHIKNAWRNHAMHNRENYGEEQAVLIYDNTRALMRHLAEELTAA